MEADWGGGHIFQNIGTLCTMPSIKSDPEPHPRLLTPVLLLEIYNTLVNHLLTLRLSTKDELERLIFPFLATSLLARGSSPPPLQLGPAPAGLFRPLQQRSSFPGLGRTRPFQQRGDSRPPAAGEGLTEEGGISRPLPNLAQPRLFPVGELPECAEGGRFWPFQYLDSCLHSGVLAVEAVVSGPDVQATATDGPCGGGPSADGSTAD